MEIIDGVVKKVKDAMKEQIVAAFTTKEVVIAIKFWSVVGGDVTSIALKALNTSMFPSSLITHISH